MIDGRSSRFRVCSRKISINRRAAVTQVKGAFKNGAQKVVSRAHFSTFLLKQQKVAFQTSIGVTWDFQKKEDADTPPKGAHTVSGSSEASVLPTTIAERFHEQCPTFKDIK